MHLPHPFVDVQGVINIRAVGDLPSCHTGPLYMPLKLKHNALYRSGEPSRITEDGKHMLVYDLGIRKAFDMRSSVEIKSFGTPSPDVDGLSFESVPVSEKEHYDPVSLAARVKAFELRETEMFLSLYYEILKYGGSSFDTIFKYLRDHPDEPCLIHCTAGKDRTGIAVALFLMLLGIEDEYIVEDYALTTIGLEPAMPALVARFEKQPLFRDNKRGTMNMASSRPETMRATLKMIRTKFDGAEGYLRTHTTLTDDDLESIRNAYLIPSV